jgi:surface antigen
MLPPKGRRSMMVNVGVAVVLVAVVLAALVAVLPTGTGQAGTGFFQIFNPSSSVVKSTKTNTALIAAQAATATAVTQDGYDAGAATYAGVPSGPTTSVPPSDVGNLNRFFYGQCTYWANMRYHELTGHWVPWLGNAGDWAYQASAYGWQTSAYPNPNGPSIIVLAPGVQGAGSYGHVAVVETGVSAAAAANGVSTSNWNWNGNWAKESWWTFYPGSGVTFVWY